MGSSHEKIRLRFCIMQVLRRYMAELLQLFEKK